MLTFEERLDELERRIEDPAFRKNSGRANEVNYWVFDYPPQRELQVREAVKRLIRRNEQGYSSYKLVEIDIYEFVIATLRKEGFLERTCEMEERFGLQVIMNAIFELLRFNDSDNLFTRYVEENTPDNAIVLLTGVGKIFPILRSHKILNNLSMSFRRVPVILFFPGSYNEQELRLFNELKDDNYYRAFCLVK